MLGLLQKTKEFSSHIIYQIPKSWVQKLSQNPEKSESGSFFQVLTHDNYEQTNGIQLEFFTQALC